MDCYGEIYMMYCLIMEGVVVVFEVIILCNGDLLIFNLKEIVNFCKYYGFNYLLLKE